MKSLLLTNEYPPHIYGGAGVHVEFLSRDLAKLIDVEVRSFGDQDSEDGRLRVRGYGLDDSGFSAPKNLTPVFGAFSRNIAMAATNVDADVVHTHTWYASLGGIVIKQAYGIP
ncbi:MAG: glycosyltransferase, partial [Chloroflexota bacterium]